MRRQRVLLTFAAVLLGLVILSEPATGSSGATSVGPAGAQHTVASSDPDVLDDLEEASEHERDNDNTSQRATSIAVGMVVAALAVGGLLVFSGR